MKAKKIAGFLLCALTVGNSVLATMPCELDNSAHCIVETTCANEEIIEVDAESNFDGCVEKRENCQDFATIMRQLDDYIANLVAGSQIAADMSGLEMYEVYKALADLAQAGAAYYGVGLSEEGVNELAEMMGAALMYGYRFAENQGHE